MSESLGASIADRYRIDRELGRGGMATVYLAEDLRHHRKVAIKVLHPELSAILGPDRFLKEIELTANLQHAHILPLFDSGSADGLLYYVMPFVEGETLRARLERERQLPIGDAIRIASDAADALAYAHRYGVVHRDIKPENILLRDGRPLLADFGIALAVQQAGGSRMTQTGMSLGTPQYMSPEQAMGDKTVDHRSDIYALGAVTYEMLAGEPPFTGPSSQAIVAKVMTEKPRPLEVLRDTVPPHVAEAVHAALQKLPADRPASAAAFAESLREPRAAPIRRAEPHVARRRLPFVLGAAGIAALALAAGYAAGRGRTSPRTETPSRLALLPPTLGGTGVSSVFRQLAVLPDGSGIVFVALSSINENELAAQRLDANDATPIAGSRGLLAPVISADGRHVIAWNAVTTKTGFEAQRAYRLPLAGGTPELLPPGVFSGSGAIASDGTLWYTTLGSGAVGRLALDGRLQPDAIPNGHALQVQQILPGDRFALVVHRQQGTGSGPLLVVDLESGERSTIVEVPVVQARYTADYLVYVQPTGTLWAAPYDLERRVITAAAVQIADGVSLSGNGYAQLDASRNGTVAYIPEEPRSLVFVDRNGVMRPATETGGNFHAPRFSPDGRRVSVDFSSADGRDVWILSLDQRTVSRATFDRDAHDATWSPDGQFIYFVTTRPGPLGVYRTRPGSSAPAESLFASPNVSYTGNWLPDGRGLLTTANNLQPGSATDIAILANGGRGPLEPVVLNAFDTQYPVASYDGRWMAYVSNQSGRQEVFVRPLDGSGPDMQVSQDGGAEPVWHPDGRQLFYRSVAAGRIDLMAATLRLAGSELEVASRTALFPIAEIAGSTPHANYDLSPDGSTFVMVRRNPAERVVVIQNLPALVEGLRTRAGGR